MKKQNDQKKKLIILISALVLILVALVAVMIATNPYKSTPETNLTTSEDTAPQVPESEVDYVTLPITDTEPKDVEFVMADGQSFTIRVLPDVAPQSAQNFLNLVRDGFYDGLTFHRVIEGFMAQGGDPEGTGMGGSENNIYGEFADNGFENNLSHTRGVVSMARSNDYNSASSQFFICYDDASFLDGQYAAFGNVTEGMDVVDSFLSAGTDETDKPLKDVVIQTARVIE